MKVLVVEDERKTAAYLKRGLEENDFVVELRRPETRPPILLLTARDAVGDRVNRKKVPPRRAATSR